MAGLLAINVLANDQGSYWDFLVLTSFGCKRQGTFHKILVYFIDSAITTQGYAFDSPTKGGKSPPRGDFLWNKPVETAPRPKP